MKSIKTQLLAIAAVTAIFGASSVFASGVHTQKTSTLKSAQSESSAELFAYVDQYGTPPDTDVPCRPDELNCNG